MENIPEWATWTFFFVSGLFFRERPFRQFLTKKIDTIVVPLLFFYMVSVALFAIKYDVIAPLMPEVDFVPVGSLSDYAFGIRHLADLHPAAEGIDAPFQVNIPLWFLVSLFFVQMIYYGFSRLLRKPALIFAACVGCYMLYILLDRNHTGPFYIDRTMMYMPYYCMGSLFGARVIGAVDRLKVWRQIALSAVLAGALWAAVSTGNMENHLFKNLQILLFIPLVLTVFKMVWQLPGFGVFTFFGRNSLVVFAMHIPVCIVLNPVIVKVTGLEFGSIPFLVVSYVLDLCCCAVAIRFFNRWMPWVVGRRDILTSKHP